AAGGSAGGAPRGGARVHRADAGGSAADAAGAGAVQSAGSGTGTRSGTGSRSGSGSGSSASRAAIVDRDGDRGGGDLPARRAGVGARACARACGRACACAGDRCGAGGRDADRGSAARRRDRGPRARREEAGAEVDPEGREEAAAEAESEEADLVPRLRGSPVVKGAKMRNAILILLAIAGVARADDHCDRAASLYADGQYAEAAVEYEASYEHAPAPRTLYAWAQAERMAGDCEAATHLYRKFLDGKPPAAHAAAAEANLARCAPSTPSAMVED